MPVYLISVAYVLGSLLIDFYSLRPALPIMFL